MKPVVALGTFDGVHLGHKKIIESAVKYAKKRNLPCFAVTFNPHPQQVIVPERGLQLLTALSERKKLIKDLGVDKVLVIKFTHHLQKLTAKQFVQRYLWERLKVAYVFVGFDYAFGKGRSGNALHLRKLGRKYGFKVVIVPPVKMNHFAIKSRIIREEVSRGDFKMAIHLLGHPYPIAGKVIRGSGRGRDLGFPTANLKVDSRKLIPSHGVYAGKVFFDRKSFKGVVNIGSRPTFGEEHVAVEVHLLGFSRNLHGKILRLELERKLREEIHFSDVKELKKQVSKDIAYSRRVC